MAMLGPVISRKDAPDNPLTLRLRSGSNPERESKFVASGVEGFDSASTRAGQPHSLSVAQDVGASKARRRMVSNLSPKIGFA